MGVVKRLVNLKTHVNQKKKLLSLADLKQNYNWSNIFSVWACFLGTWAMVKYTGNFYTVLPNWASMDILNRTEICMALIAMLSNLIKIHLDWFHHGTRKMRMMASIITTFVAFCAFGAFMGMSAHRFNKAANGKDVETHGYWFGWIAFVFHFMAFVTTFCLPRDSKV